MNLNWRSLYSLINGMLGRSIIVISMATPMALLYDLGLSFPNYKVALTGSLLILLSYIISSIATPQLVISFDSSYSYADNLVEANIKNCLDYVSEFKILEDNSKSLPKGYNSFDFSNYDFNNIEESIKELGDNVCVRSLALIKYDYINKKNIKYRMTLTVIFICGLLFFYYPVLYQISRIFLEG